MSFPGRVLLFALLSIFPISTEAAAAIVRISVVGTVVSGSDPQGLFSVALETNELRRGKPFSVTAAFDTTKGLRETLPDRDALVQWPSTDNPFLGGLLIVGTAVHDIFDYQRAGLVTRSNSTENLFGFYLNAVSATFRSASMFFTPSVETPFVYVPGPGDRYQMSLFYDGLYDRDGNQILGETTAVLAPTRLELTVSETPLPASLALFPAGLGLLALAAIRRRRRAQ